MNPENRGYFLRNNRPSSPVELQDRDTVHIREEQQEAQPQPDPLPQVPVLEPRRMIPVPGLQLEKFAGDDQVTAVTWMQWFERFCAWHKYDEGTKVLTMPFHLTSHARIWFDSLSDDTKTDYNRLKAAFLERFKHQDEMDPELLEIAQRPDECANDYFSRVLKRAQHSGANDKIIISLAIKGLKPAIKQIVMPQNHQTFENARQHSILAEKTLLATTTPVAAYAHQQVPSRADFEALRKQLLDQQATIESLRQEKAVYEHKPSRQQEQQQPQFHQFNSRRRQWRKPAQHQQNWQQPTPPQWQQPAQQYQQQLDWRQQPQHRNGSDSRLQEDRCPGCKGEDLNCNYPIYCRSKYSTCSLCKRKGHYKNACIPENSK
ncbi:MAG: hypothetical protein AB2766_18520 [Candidatus Thiodiazotropha endolucinida]